MTDFDIGAAKMELFMFPGACSRVTMSALEEAGLAYSDQLINIQSQEQKSAAYKAVNPKGKVPALRVGDAIMTENAAIIHFIDRHRPSAHLLPHDADGVRDNQGLIDLIWCSGTLHPMVRQIRNPMRWTTGETAGVRNDGLEKFAHECHGIASRVSGGRWWYGANWSIVDVYLYWAYSTAEKGGFPLAEYPDLIEHAARVRARPSFERAFRREQAAAERNKAGLPPDFQV